MDWLRVEFCVDEKRLPDAEALLQELGAVSIECADAGDMPILEPAPGSTPLWPMLRVSALFAGDAAQDIIASRITNAAVASDCLQLRFRRIADRNWVAEFQRRLEPLRFGDRLWIVPAGQVCPDPDAVQLNMDPGLAFGTGEHASTALCLDWLADAALDGRRILDYGCGSGVLAIAALALGAYGATAVDIDPQALDATRTNAERNGLHGKIAAVSPTQLDRGLGFDVILANILSNTLAELAPVLLSLARPGTRIALSGILANQIEQVSQQYDQHVNFDAPRLRGDWAMLVGTVA